MDVVDRKYHGLRLWRGFLVGGLGGLGRGTGDAGLVLVAKTARREGGVSDSAMISGEGRYVYVLLRLVICCCSERVVDTQDSIFVANIFFTTNAPLF